MKFPLALWVLVDAAACFRLTRLVTSDMITEPLRTLLVGRDRVTRMVKRMGLFDFITCPWCVSPYVGAGVLALTLNVRTWWSYVAAVLALSAVAGMASAVTSD